MRSRGRLGAVLICGLLVSSCSQQAEQASVIDKLRAEVDALKAKAGLLEKRLAMAESRIIRTETAATLEKERYANATFDPSDSSYQRIDANVGTFAVSLTDVRPFADGVRVTLKLGNLSSATFYGATLKLHYGGRMPNNADEKFFEKYASWNTALKDKEQSIVSNLAPGRWNPVQVVLPGIEAKDFGYLEVSVATDKIGLY